MAILTPPAAETGVATDEQKPPGADAGAAEPHATPRWVKVFGGILIVVLLLFLLLMLTGGPGRHGPRRHFGDAVSGAVHPVVAMPATWTGADA
jgi:hypothetical protein